MISRILNRLHRVFNKDPQPYQVLYISSTVGGKLDIDETGITITHRYDTVKLVFADKTLNELLIEINAKPYLHATLKQPTYSSLLAKGLLPAIQQDLADGRVYMASSIFHNEMQVYAGQLQQQADMLADGEKQLYLHSAEADWLDYWGKDYLGLTRNEDEQNSDEAYLSRIIATVIKPTQNNNAIAKALKNATGLNDCEVLDTVAGAEDTLRYDGSALYAGEHTFSHKYGTQPGCFYITADLPTEDGRALTAITKALVATANAIKAAGTKLDGVEYKTSASDTATITESTTLTAIDGQADIFPWGSRYNGSVQHNSGRLLVYDGADSYAGETTFNGAVAGAVTYNNAWDLAQSTGHTVAADQQQAVVSYNGLASYDGVFDQGATPPPVYDTRMVVTARRHNLFNGLHRYGADKQHDGTLHYAGSADFSQMTYAGVHVIQEVTI